MNKLPLFLLCFCFVAATFPQSATPNIEDGLIAYYSFNYCNANDETNGGSDGKLYGDPDCWCGVEGNGLLFDGVHDYIVFEGRVNHYFNTSDFTLSFYFKPMQQSVFRESLISKRATCEAYNMLDIQYNQQAKEIKTSVNETPSKSYGDISPIINNDKWHHFALVREGIFAYTYINGHLQKEGRRCSGVDIENDAFFSFSNSPCLQTGATRRFKGVLDELRVYDRAFSHKEIAALYALNPIENAAIDCFTYQDFPIPNQKKSKDLFLTEESTYICALECLENE